MTTEEGRLDNPVWTALTTHQAGLAVGESYLALRFPTSISALGAQNEDCERSLKRLAELTPNDAPLAMYILEKKTVPKGMVTVIDAVCHQMIGVKASSSTSDNVMLLNSDHDAQIVELARICKLGLRFEQTRALGRYYGVIRDGKLVAMAGERLSLPGFVEISGVCTHPKHRREGLGSSVTARISREILNQGRVPFLHVHEANTSAISIYEGLGFEYRKSINFRLFYHDQ